MKKEKSKFKQSLLLTFMKKQVSTGVLAGAQTFLGNGKPWGFGNQNQMAAPLDPSVQKMTDEEDAELNQNLEDESNILGKWAPNKYDYSFPATVHGPGAGPDNLTDMEKASKEPGIQEQAMSQRTPADQFYFDLPGTPKAMWFAKPENHMPVDRREPYEVEHLDDFLDDLFVDQEPLNLTQTANTPNDYEATTLYQRGQLYTMPIDTDHLVIDNPKHRVGGELEEQADPTRWYLRSLSAKAITNQEVDNIRQKTEPLLLGDPELDDDVVEMSPFSFAYLSKPKQWIEKEEDTDIRTLDDQRKRITYEEVKRQMNEVSLKSIISPIEAWVATGNRSSFQTLMRMFQIAKREDAVGDVINLISQYGMRVATDGARRKRVMKLLSCLEE